MRRRKCGDYRLGKRKCTDVYEPGGNSPWPENNTVHGQFFPARKQGPAVLVLPNWNGEVARAGWRFAHWLQRMGISAMKMSLPYHDRRMAKGHERADQLVGPNIGLTLAANRQAVKDARACLDWLEQRGYTRLGILWGRVLDRQSAISRWCMINVYVRGDFFMCRLTLPTW